MSNEIAFFHSTARIEILGNVILKIPMTTLNLSSFRDYLAFALGVPVSAVDFAFVEYFNANAIPFNFFSHLNPNPASETCRYILLFKAFINVPSVNATFNASSFHEL
jgi:hypothetical protein